jgi:hypothetical protein
MSLAVFNCCNFDVAEFVKYLKEFNLKKIPNKRNKDRLCGLMVRVPGYRSIGPDFLRSSGSGTGSTQPQPLVQSPRARAPSRCLGRLGHHIKDANC